MFRLTTPDGFVLEFDRESDLRSALGWLREKATAAATERRASRAAEKRDADASVGATVGEIIKRFGRTDGRRRLLQALIEADGPVSGEQLASDIEMDRNKMLGTLGAIYANAADLAVPPNRLVRREERRGASGRRTYRYAAGPLLRGESE